jgi:hypothetical protein
MHILGLLGLIYIPYNFFPFMYATITNTVPLLGNHMKEAKCIELQWRKGKDVLHALFHTCFVCLVCDVHDNLASNVIGNNFSNF